ncbi:sigma-54 dependent transcriptional regulator [bacterium]|nr:sigma-54 dependent transcriptional regulator [bacterium]
MSKRDVSLLLVDDDLQALDAMKKILEFEDYRVETATDGQQALDLVRSGRRFHAVVTDVRMPKLGGLDFLKAITVLGSRTPVILMTAFGEVEDAVWAMKCGAVDFLTKPFKRQALLSAVSLAVQRSLRAEDLSAETTQGPQLIGSSDSVNRLRVEMEQVARTSATILLSGESGTGKELVARRIHELSDRASGPWVALNCGAFPEQLIESELFGYEKGAFTGALSAKAGLFEAAHGGTILLDEIGDMPILLQTKLLRVLQEGEFRRVGATTSKKVDVRVIAATHRDLRERVKTGEFREDLLYRLEVISLSVPALRSRKEDIPALAENFVSQAAQRHHKNLALSPEALEILLQHSWPGNVRELSNVIERAAVFAQGDLILPRDLPMHLQGLVEISTSGDNVVSVKLGTPLREVEEMLIRKTLEATSGDKNMTAKLLGINSRTIYRKLDKKPESEPEPEAGL